MAKRKMKKFSEVATFPNVFQYLGRNSNFLLNHKGEKREYRGRWHEDVFQNERPIILELACGKGHYTIGMANFHPENNYLGIDIKAARMWTGAKYALENKLKNVAFARIQIEWISKFFGPGEVDQIWITFPDPQAKIQRAKKRLTGAWFLSEYRQILKPDGIIHLKTDSDLMYRFTKGMISLNKLEIIEDIPDVYVLDDLAPELCIETEYEKIHREQGSTIKYIAFRMPSEKMEFKQYNLWKMPVGQ